MTTIIEPANKWWYYNCPNCKATQNLYARIQAGKLCCDDPASLAEAFLSSNAGGYLTFETRCEQCKYPVKIDIGLVPDELRVWDYKSESDNYLDITTVEE